MKVRNSVVRFFLTGLFFAAPVMAQQYVPVDFRQSSADVLEIARNCRVMMRDEFRFGEYVPRAEWRVNGQVFPRRNPTLYRGVQAFIPRGRNPIFQFDLNRVVRGILGEETNIIGSFTVDSLTMSFTRHSDDSPLRPEMTYLAPAIRNELREMAVVEAVETCVYPAVVARGGLNRAEAQQLAAIVVNKGFLNLRVSTRGEPNDRLEPTNRLADLYFRYFGGIPAGSTSMAIPRTRQYHEFPQAVAFSSVHPEVSANYGYWSIVFNDPGNRAFDLNAYNHAYYAPIRGNYYHGDGSQDNFGGNRFYSCSSVDNGEFITPAYIRPMEMMGMDVRPRLREGNIGTRARQHITVAYRKIPLVAARSGQTAPSNGVLASDVSISYSPVMAIDGNFGGSYANCIVMDSEGFPTTCAPRPNPMASGGAVAPSPSASSNRLKVVGFFGLCSTRFDETSGGCHLPNSLVEKYQDYVSEENSPAFEENRTLINGGTWRELSGVPAVDFHTTFVRAGDTRHWRVRFFSLAAEVRRLAAWRTGVPQRGVNADVTPQSSDSY